MLVLEILLILGVIVVSVAVALGWGDRLVDVPVDRAPSGLPRVDRLGAYDVSQVRFNLALRGYRMAEVDAVLAQLAAELADRDAAIAELESHLAAAGRVGGMTTLPGSGPDFLPPTPSTPGATSDPVPPAQPGELLH